MTKDERYQHHYNEMIAWAEGTKSNWSIFHTIGGNTPECQAACAVADAAEVAKHAAVVMALRVAP